MYALNVFGIGAEVSRVIDLVFEKLCRVEI